MKAPAFTQIRPEEPVLSRVERNVATTLEAHASLLNGGLTLEDNTKGVLLPQRDVEAPLTSPLQFSMGKGTVEPLCLALVYLRAADGTRYSGGVLKWRWGVVQGIGQLTLQALPSEVDTGTYTMQLFAVGA